MNKFAFGALAAPLLCATSMAADTEWPELDRELAALSNAPLTQNSGGPFLNGWLISAFDYNSDAEDSNKNQTDVGFDVPSARIQLEGDLAEGYGYKIGYDFFDTMDQYAPSGSHVGSAGTAGITDAYGRFGIGEYVDFKFGIFNGPSLRSASLDRNKTLFINRSFLGMQQSCSDAGLEVGGSFDRVNWSLAGTNGTDGKTDGFAYGIRIDVDLMGEMSDVEGAYGAQEGTNFNVGFVYTDDNSKDAATGASMDLAQMSADATLVSGPFSVFAEVIDYDKHTGPYYGGAMIDAKNTPWSAGASYLFGEEYEVGFRYDTWDAGQTSSYYDTSRYNFVVNKYIDGHDIKWQLEFGFGDSKMTGTASDKVGEHTIIAIALALGF